MPSDFLASARAAPGEFDHGDEPRWIAIGTAFESTLVAAERSGRGAHFTPPWLARAIVVRTVDANSGPVTDPACGGGVFVLTALDRLVECGVDPGDALSRVIGHDVDPTSLGVVDLAVRWWAQEHGVDPSRVRLDPSDPLLGPGPPAIPPHTPVVLGNPPFLDQLDTRSARDEARREALRSRFGGDLGAYTDEAAVFLAWAVDAAGPTGSVGMVLPRSVLATRDAAAVRRRVAERTALRTIWFDDPNTFDAGVRVCAVVTHADTTHADTPATTVDVCGGRDFASVCRVAVPDPHSWSPLLAAAQGVPPVAIDGNGELGDLVEVIAGFRDEYYGLTSAVEEAQADSPHPRLVTSGAIDLAEPLWGRRTIRFDKRRWSRPVVDRAAIEIDRVGLWVDRVLRPKVLVATQTRVIEATVDEAGRCIGSVPVLNVVPRDPAAVWLVAAAIASPPVVAWAFARRSGAALSADAIKLSAKDVRAMPLPADRERWQDGARAFEAAQISSTSRDRTRALDHFGEVMTDAYRCDPTVATWWSERRN